MTNSDHNTGIDLVALEIISYYNRGIAKFKLGDYHAAISNYDRTISIEPSFSEAYNNRGLAKFELSQIAEAISDYNLAIVLNPKFAKAYNNRGIASAI